MKIVVPAVAAVVATSAIAVAAIPGAGGQINGCYATGGLQKGNVRIVDEGVACRNGETAISWNQKGQKGDGGPAGPAGLAGAKGDKGDAGLAGAAGIPGATGSPGAPGAKGDTGPAGTNGNDGKNGVDGKDGSKGADGSAGPAGPKGDTGATGPAGPQGAQGPAGPAGAGGIDALTLGGEALAGGTADAFLKLVDTDNHAVEGESVVRGHEKEIEINSFDFSIENAITFGGASGGAGAGKVKFGNVHITKLFDKATDDLVKTAATGDHFADGTITFRSRGGEAVDFLTIKFKLVFVSKWEQGGKAEPPLLENVDFQVGSFQVDYKPRNPNGSFGTTQTFGWDQTRNAQTNF